MILQVQLASDMILHHVMPPIFTMSESRKVNLDEVRHNVTSIGPVISQLSYAKFQIFFLVRVLNCDSRALSVDGSQPSLFSIFEKL